MGTRLIITPLLMLSGVAVLANGWAGTPALAVLVAAVLVPYFLVLAAARTRIPLSLAAAIPVLAVVIASVLTTDRVGIGWLRAPIDAVARLLTAPRPAPPTLELLLPGVLLAVIVGTWVGVRAARNGGGFAAMLGAAVLYVAGALLTAGMADRFGVLAAVMVLLAAAGWIARPAAASTLQSPPPRRMPRRIPRGIALIAIATIGATVAATLAPSADAFEPRRLVSPPSLPLVEPNPLPRLAAYAERGDVELLRYSGSETRLHLVTLADFDGAVWRANGRYQPVGAVVQAPSLPPAPRRTVATSEITIAALDGLWLPTPGDPDEVSLPDARVDAETGSLALPQGLRGGLQYRVRAAIDAPNEGLSVAEVPSTAATRYLQIPRLPYTFARYAELAVQGANTPLEQAVLLETAVRQGRKLDTRAPDGSSYARLATFLFGSNAGLAYANGAQTGTSEQFAAAFAVLARAVGLPSRLRAGFRSGDSTPGGGWVVRGRHALVWPEVYFAGQGWVAFDPTPSDQDSFSTAVADLKRQALDKVGGAQPQAPVNTQPSRAAVPVPSPSVSRSLPAPPPPLVAPGASPLVSAIGLPLGLLASLLGLLLLLRTLRRLRHRRAGARGAWSEVLDLLPLLNLRPPRWHSADRIAEDLSVAVPTDPPHPAHRLAKEADRAAFAAPTNDPRAGRAAPTPGPSPARGSAAVAGSWGEMRRLVQAARRTVPWYRRILWPIDPRPLLRR